MSDSPSSQATTPVTELRHEGDPTFRRVFLLTFAVLAVYLALSLSLSFGPLKKKGYGEKKPSAEASASETAPSPDHDADPSH